MPAAPAAKKPTKEQRKPDVIVGDEVYCHHPKGPHAGKVKAHGEHGVTLDSGHKVRWEHVLGHKRRAGQEYSVVDEGEDGMIVQDKNGLRQFVAVPPEARTENMVVKSQAGTRVAMMLKAKPGAGGAYTGRPGLTQRQVTDKNGVLTKRWVSTAADAPPAQPGHHVGWVNGEHKGHGEVTASGRDGLRARDSAGGMHLVRHKHVTHHWADANSKPEKGPHGAEAHKGDPDHFNAAEFAKQHDDPDATPESIVAAHGPDAAGRIEQARQRLKDVQQTIDAHKSDDSWSEERAALHRKLMFDGIEVNGKKVPGMLAPEKVKAATPAPGEQPTFIALGGRGGSGKSSLNGRVYDDSRAIVIDPDHIKSMLPEYQGWNAHQVHEESSEVADRVIAMARMLGLNIVLDATMKSTEPVNRLVDDFNAHGYRTEAHYMHLPRQEATKRAIGRFMNGGEKGRFVPPEVVMGNTKNEANFDSIKGKVHAWSFHDNQGGKDEGPKLIAKKGEFATAPKQALRKAEPALIIFMSNKVQHEH